MTYLDTLKAEFAKGEAWLATEFSRVHTGRASLVFLDGVMVESYGVMGPLRNVASLTIEDPTTIKITPWDKSLIKEVERGVQAANLGLSIAPDDTGIRVIFPPLTGESRERIVKVLKEKLEDARQTVRKEREAVIQEVERDEKDKKISEDDKFRFKTDIQRMVDAQNKKLEDMFSAKEKEILG